MRKVNVNLKDRSYQILIKNDLFNGIGKHIKDIVKTKNLCIITDENIARLYMESLETELSVISKEPLIIIIPPGEEQKNLSTVSMIYDKLLERTFDRNSTILAFGGGVVGDIAGFTAATFLRGIDYMQIPTTLLSQVDSSVGGKTGVNHVLGKNLIGAFHQPKRVLIDPLLLKTLSKRDLNSGLIEIVKHSIIGNTELFELIEDNLENILSLSTGILEEIIDRNCRIKASIVSRDEKEKGIRIVLNLGHTTGHAFENLTDYGELRHGEAVAFGIIVASFISNKMGCLNDENCSKITNLILKIIPKSIIPSVSPVRLIDAMSNDKKRRGGKLRFVLPSEIGKTFVKDNINQDLLNKCVKDAFQYLKNANCSI